MGRRWLTEGCLPGHGKGRDNLVAQRDRGDLTASLDDGADELVAHDETCWRRLVATEDVQFSGMVSVHLVEEKKRERGREVRRTSRIAPWIGP